MNTIATISLLSVLATIIVTILVYTLIMPEKKRASLSKFFRFCHDWLHMKSLIIEKIIRFFYVFTTVSVICTGFFMLFWTQEIDIGYNQYTNTFITRDQWMGWYGLLILAVGPVAVRIVYEILMMFLLLIKNVMQINNKLKDQNEEIPAAPAAPAAYTAPAAPAYVAPAAPVATAPVAPAPQAAPAEPAPAPAAPAAPAPKFCTRCGAHLNEDGTCPNCN